MGRRKIERTPAEEEKIKKARREKKNKSQRERRLLQNTNTSNVNTPAASTFDIFCQPMHSDVAQNITIDITDNIDISTNSLSTNGSVVKNFTNIPSTSHSPSELDLTEYPDFNHLEYDNTSESITPHSRNNFFEHNYCTTSYNDLSNNDDNINNCDNVESTLLDLNNIPSTSHTSSLSSYQFKNNYFEHNYSRFSKSSSSKSRNPCSTVHNYNITTNNNQNN